MADRLAVLTYHRIADGADGPPGIISASPRAFERQVRWLARARRPVSLDAVLRARTEGAPLPARAVLVTFDDGYEDFAEVAWPILRRHGVPAALFVPTAFPGSASGFWWDRLWVALRDEPDRAGVYRALRARVKALPHDAAMELVDAEIAARRPGPTPAVLDWPALRALAADGVAVCAHTRTHPLLHRVSAARAADEVHGSLADLRGRLGDATPAAFAYPAGAGAPAARAALEQAGVVAAFSTGGGVCDLARADWLALDRVNVGRRSPLPVLRARLRWAEHAPRSGAPVAPAPVDAAPAPRVAYVTSRFPKLTETFVLAEILAVRRRGVAVDVYPLLPDHERVTHPETRLLAPHVRRLPFVSPEIAAAQLHWLGRRPAAYVRALRDVVVGTWRSPRFLAGGLATFPKVACAARRMERDGVRHVHCHFAHHPALAGLVIQRLTGIPFSFTAHGSDLHRDRTMLARKVAEAAFVAAISDDNRRVITDECGARAATKVHVIRAGIDVERFSAEHRESGAAAPQRPLRIVCIGTLHEVKGQAHLVDACGLLRDAGVPVSCRLVGDGPDRAALLEQIARLRLNAAVTLTGALVAADVVRELRRADVLAAPSVPSRDGRREGLPVVLMEGMASSLPVVASRLSGIPELVEDGVTGLLVAPGDATALAGALRQLAGAPALRDRLGAAGRERVLRDFAVDRSAAELVARFALERAA